MPDLPYAVSNAVMVVQSNSEQQKIYLLGGRKKNTNAVSSFYNSVFAFDVNTKTWEEKKSIPSPKAAGTGIAVGKNYILLFLASSIASYHLSITTTTELTHLI